MRAEVTGIYENAVGDRFFYRAGAELPDGLVLWVENQPAAETRVEPAAPKGRRAKPGDGDA